MEAVIDRGTKNTPRWFVRFVDADGKRKQRVTGARSKTEAMRILDEVQARVARGESGEPVCMRAGEVSGKA